jgi:glucose-1-phosphate adenylyltransferase
VKGTLAIVLAGGRGTRLGPLTAETPKPVLPFGGTYRLVDFVFSNCVNSGAGTILFVTRHGSGTVIPYLERLRDTLPPGSACRILVEQARPAELTGGGTAEAVLDVLPLVRRIAPRLVLVLASDHVYRMDYAPMIELHRSAGAGVTIGSVEVSLDDASELGVLEAEASGRIVRFVEKPPHPAPLPGRPGRACASMGIYVFDPRVLEAALAADSLDELSTHDFGRDVIPKLVRSREAWRYGFSGYWRDVGTVASYMAAHRELLASPDLLKLHDPTWPILSAAWPTLPRAIAVNRHGSLLCPGSLCEPGSRVRRCVVSPAARVGQGASLEECVVLDGAQVGRGAQLRRVIVGVAAEVPAGTLLGWDTKDERAPLVVSGAVDAAQSRALQ